MKDDFYKKIIMYLLGALCLLTPLIVGRKYFFPFIFPKIIFASFVIQIIFIVYLVYVINQKKLEFNFKKSVILFLAYVGWLLVSMVFGMDPYNSLWGNAERMEGLYFLFNFFLLFLILTQLFQDKELVIFTLRFFLFGSLLSFIYAILQVVRVSIPWVLAGTGSFSSSLGNPALFATYLVFPFWFAIYLWFVDDKRSWRLFYASISLISFVFAFLTQSRASLLGIFVGLIVASLLFTLKLSNRNIRKYFASLGLILVFLIALIFLFRQSDLVKKIPTISRIASIGLNDPTTASRIISAKIALVGLKEHPFLGWGHNNFFYLYAKHYDPRNLTNDPQFFDKPHNKYLEVLTENGIIGLILYVTFIAFLIKGLWRDLSAVTIVLLGMLTTYLFQNTFIFDTPSTYLGLTLLLALVVIYDKKFKVVSFSIKKSSKLLASAFIILSVIYILSLFYYLGMNAQGIKILMLVPQRIGEPKVVEQMMTNFFDKNTFLNREILINLASQLSFQVEPYKANNKESLKIIYKKMKHEFDKKSNNYRLGVSLLKIASLLSLVDKTYANSYLEYMPKVIALAPNRLEGYYENGLFFFRNNNLVKAKEQYLKVISLNPNYVPPLWQFGVMLLLAEDYNTSKIYVEKALAKGFNYRNAQGFAVLIELYVKLNDLVLAEKYLQEAKKAYPDTFKNVVLPSPNKNK